MTASNNPPDLIYSDDSLLVVDKPAGLLAVPGRGEDKQDCLSARLQLKFPDALVVHRLDMATSGLMVFARGTEMQRRLSQLFREREVQKRYVAVVAGRLQQEAGEVALPLICDWPNRPRQKIDHALGKPSLTRYRLMDDVVAVRPELVEGRLGFDKLSPNGLLETSGIELEPITGRTHQLRVHMAAIGHPILGDALYGDATSAPRLLLHACRLGFSHPRSGEPLNFECAAPFLEHTYPKAQEGISAGA
jgi:tRNA pseudouridine32 synthase/23S rRNA pseudouridine746 synthase